jgi:hypothetical protein
MIAAAALHLARQTLSKKLKLAPKDIWVCTLIYAFFGAI